MNNNKKLLIIIAVSGILSLACFAVDEKTAGLFYLKNNIFGAVCVNVVPSLMFFLASFFCGTLLLHRSSHASRAKMRVYNVLYLLLCFAFAAVGGYYPFRSVKTKPFVIIGLIAVAAAGLFVYLNYSLFKTPAQKQGTAAAAKRIVISVVCVCAVCLAVSLIPGRVSFSELMTAKETYSQLSDTSALGKTSYVSFAAASGAMSLWLCELVPYIRKVKLNKNAVFIAVTVWAAVVALGVVTYGESYPSAVFAGIFVGALSVFIAGRPLRQ